MNKKECEYIAYLLSEYGAGEELLQGIFDMDSRIEPGYVGFEECAGRSEKVDELANKLMCERNNTPYHHYSLMKKEYLKCSYSQCLEEARKEIYGDDYHPSLFKRKQIAPKVGNRRQS